MSIWWIKLKTEHFFKKLFGGFKLETWETEIITNLIKKHKDDCGFNTDYTIFKIEKYLSKK